MTNTATKTVKSIYCVPATNLPGLTETLAKLNKRAKRLGVPEITMETELDYTEHQYKNALGSTCWWTEEEAVEKTANNDKSTYPMRATGTVRQWHEVAIKGQGPKLDGWRFVGTLEPVNLDDGTAENIIQSVPGETVPKEYRNRVGECDHCNTTRKRNQTFVVVHDNGDSRMVGRNCVRDFLGHKDPHHLAAWAEFLASVETAIGGCEEEGYFGGGGNVPTVLDLEHYVAWVFGAVAQVGWCSRGRARESCGELQATADYVAWLLDPPPFAGRDAAELRKEHEEKLAAATPNESHKAKAAEAVEWALELSNGPEELVDYLYNLNLVCRVGAVQLRKTDGLAASLPAAHARAMDKELAAKKRAARPASKHVGEIKKRQEFIVRCEKVMAFESDYGTTGMHLLTVLEHAEAEYGDDMVWWASSSAEWLEAGEVYCVKATPQKHDDYNGRPQTKVNRLAIQEYISCPPEPEAATA